jgi:hypothetical protein
MYLLHLSLANSWKNNWPCIQHTIERKLQREIRIKYKNLDKKLNRLAQIQTTTPQQRHTFHPRVTNNTNILFSQEEMILLQKDLNATYTPNRKTGYETWPLRLRLHSHSYPLPIATSIRNQ